jgi:hypothetical protein
MDVFSSLFENMDSRVVVSTGMSCGYKLERG